MFVTLYPIRQPAFYKGKASDDVALVTAVFLIMIRYTKHARKPIENNIMTTELKEIRYVPETGPRKGLPCLYYDGKERIDYEKLYYRVEHLHPELAPIIEHIRKIIPAYNGEYKALLIEVHNHPEQIELVRQRLFDISLRFILKDAVYYYERFKIDIQDVFQCCAEAMLKTIDVFITKKEVDSSCFLSYYSLKAMNEISGQFFRKLPNGTYVSRTAGTLYTKFLGDIYHILGNKYIYEWDKDEIKEYFRKNNKICLSVESMTEGCFPTVELTDEISESIPESEEKESEKDPLVVLEEILPPTIYGLLRDREKYLLSRMFCYQEEKQPTLQLIGNELHVSRERVRQLEMHVLRKLRRYFKHYPHKDLLLYKQ